MSDYIFKIQPRFLANVRNNFKKHEYRLCKGDKPKIKPGDYIRLVSNDNENDYSRVIVNEISQYKDWEDALKDDWEGDFANVAKSYEEAVHICKSFYSQEDVQQYGIIKYDIQSVDGIDYKILRIEKASFNDIDISSTFFDTLKEDYSDFLTWFKKKQSNKDYAYVYRGDKGDITALLYLKPESGEDNSITPIFSNKKRLKIGTFKVSGLAKGFRLGERFLKIAFDNAIEQDVDELYITLFEKRDEVKALKKLLLEWGFTLWGTKGDKGESVFVKLLKSYDSNETIKFNFPILPQNSNMFYLPILAKHHTKLFPDFILKTENIDSFYDPEPSSYSLEKIYISKINPYSKGAKNGDILVIYYMGESVPKHYSSTCTGLAALVEAKTYDNLSEFLKDCKNKTVFNNDELTVFFNTNKYRTVIKLIPYKVFKKKIPLYKLRKEGILGIEGPRPFDPINKEFYEYFKKQQ